MATATPATPFAPFVYRDVEGSELDFSIVGGEAQVLQVLLPPGAKIQAEPGALFYMDENVVCSTQSQGIFGSLNRWFSGESIFVNAFTNKGNSPEYVAFATHTMARLLPLDLRLYGGSVIAQSSAYFASFGDVTLGTRMMRSFTGVFGREGILWQELKGQGLCFITAGGTPVQKILKPNETCLVDAGSIVAMQSTVSYELQYTGSIKKALFGGEGLFLQKLTGPGLVILESLPNQRLIDSLQSADMRARTAHSNMTRGLLLLTLIFMLLYAAINSFDILADAIKYTQIFTQQMRHHLEL